MPADKHSLVKEDSNARLIFFRLIFLSVGYFRLVGIKTGIVAFKNTFSYMFSDVIEKFLELA